MCSIRCFHSRSTTESARCGAAQPPASLNVRNRAQATLKIVPGSKVAGCERANNRPRRLLCLLRWKVINYARLIAGTVRSGAAGRSGAEAGSSEQSRNRPDRNGLKRKGYYTVQIDSTWNFFGRWKQKTTVVRHDLLVAWSFSAQ